MRLRKTALAAALLALSLGACDSLPSWMGGTPKKEPEKLAGTRIPALPNTTKLQPDEELAKQPLTIPAAEANDAWPQHGGNALAQIDNVALPAKLTHQDSATAGEGNAFATRLIPDPVASDGLVFAMDADGYLSAHDAKHVSDIKWTSHGVSDADDNPVLGGGLAVDNSVLYAASGRGLVAAFDAKTGKETWRQNLNIPIRSAPRVESGHVYVITVDSQTYALDAKTGQVAWNHRGVNEGGSFLVEATPAATSEWVAAPYPSGDIHLLHAADGSENWSDTVMGAERGSALSQFTGIGGDPVVKEGALYVAGSAELFAAFQLDTGRRVWEQPMSSTNTPWVSGDYVFVLTTQATVVAMQRMDGRIRWVCQLPRFENAKDKRNPYTWSGPVMAGGRLLVVGAHGVMAEIKPEDGAVLAMTDIPDGITAAPVVAGGVAYLESQDATLYALY